MAATKVGIEIWNLDGTGLRCAVAVNGLVRYVGARDDCLRRASILAAQPNRGQQDQMLLRILG